MTTLASLRGALQAVEAAIPTMALRLLQAAPEVLTAYGQYRTDCRAWCAARPGALAWAAILDGDSPPPAPAILRAIMPSAPVICAGDDAAATYHSFKDHL